MDKRDGAGLYIWSPGKSTAQTALDDNRLSDGWKVYHKNRLSWTKDGKRLFVGTKPGSEIISEEEENKDTVPDLFDTEKILADRALDIWHWNDTLMPDLRMVENRERGIGSSNLRHSKKITWDTRLNDYYLVDLETGERKMFLEKFRSNPILSPDGKKVVYYNSGDWIIMDAESNDTINLTAGMGAFFTDEDHDYPEPAPGYGTGGWVNGSEAVLIYDKYDIWQFPSDGSKPICLTGGKGREEKYQFRISDLDPERVFYNDDEQVLVEAYHDLLKFTAVYSMAIGKSGINIVIEEAVKFNLLSKAKNDEKILYTRETYTEFPDLWVSKPDFRKPLKLTDVNPQVREFAWGKAELVSWSNIDGRSMQGVLIKPGNYQPGKKYPVLVYYYRFMSNLLYSFTRMEVNHRPCFPYYASNGYAVFLPDIRFDIGYPGFSATKCLVPGVRKLIDMGIADPDGIALHGHSWSGYQTAFVITQTDMFACAIAGAPVSNMTSAYSGIRLESGLARQMQYEKGQSRIGGSLWEYPERYIENSPVFCRSHQYTPADTIR